MGAFKHTGGHPNIWGHPNVQGIWTPLSVTKDAFFVLCMYRGHPNIFQTYGASKHGGIQIYRGLSNHMEHQNIQGVHHNKQGTSKHIGGVQTYGGIQMYGGIWIPPQSDKACFICVVYVQQASKHLTNIWRHPNIWECPHIKGTLKHRGVQTYGGIQTYRRVSKHTGDASK